MAKKKQRKRTLNHMERRFCYQYVLLLNGTRAAIAANYSKKTARAMACELLKRPHVKKEIERLQNDLAQTAQISALRVLKEHEKVAFGSMGHYHKTWIKKKEFEELTDEQKSSIKSIQTQIRKEEIDGEATFVEYVKIELYDKLRSLEAISTMLGYNAPEKTEITGKDGQDLLPKLDFSKLTDEELKQYHAIISKIHG